MPRIKKIVCPYCRRGRKELPAGVDRIATIKAEAIFLQKVIET